MPAIDVVSDASVALKWFHAEGEEELEPSRDLLAAHQNRTVALHVLDAGLGVRPSELVLRLDHPADA
jgi:hypothetical protein